MRFEERVMLRLRRLGKTQKELADAVNYSPTYICDVLHGRSSPEVRGAIDTALRAWELQERDRAEQEKERRRRDW